MGFEDADYEKRPPRRAREGLARPAIPSQSDDDASTIGARRERASDARGA